MFENAECRQIRHDPTKYVFKYFLCADSCSDLWNHIESLIGNFKKSGCIVVFIILVKERTHSFFPHSLATWHFCSYSAVMERFIHEKSVGCSKNDGGEVIPENDVGQSITVILKRKDILSILFSYCAFCIHILLMSPKLYWSPLKKDKINILITRLLCDANYFSCCTLCLLFIPSTSYIYISEILFFKNISKILIYYKPGKKWRARDTFIVVC